MKRGFGERLEERALLFYSVYAAGLTVGALGALSSAGKYVFEPAGGMGYAAGSFAFALVFFAAAMLPVGAAGAVSALAAAAVYGLFIGASASAALLSAAPLKGFLLGVFPRLVAVTPLLFYELCVSGGINDMPRAHGTKTARVIKTVLVSISASCVQIAVFWFLTQFNSFLQQNF